MTNYIEICCTIDAAFVEHCAVTLHSLRKNSKSDLRVWLVHQRTDWFAIRRFRRYLEMKGIEAHLCPFDSSMLAGAQISHHVSLATYFRLMLGSVLPSEIDKLIFIDSDTLVLHDIADLWKMDLCGSVLAAVEETGVGTAHRTALGLAPGDSYFNAGVLLLSLRQWREMNFEARCLQIISEYSNRLRFWDQDVLNVCLRGKWKRLDPRWNVLTSVFHTSRNASTIDSAIADPAIVHFSGAGSCKPWLANCEHPFKLSYLDYKSKAKWKKPILDLNRIAAAVRRRISKVSSVLKSVPFLVKKENINL